MAENGLQTRTINCKRCGTLLTVHPAAFFVASCPYATVYSLSASWSIDERICPNCKAIQYPVLRLTVNENGAPVYDWDALIDPAEKQNRIIVPQLNIRPRKL